MLERRPSSRSWTRAGRPAARQRVRWYDSTQRKILYEFSTHSTEELNISTTQLHCKRKPPDIFPVHLTSRQYAGKYTKNIPVLVTNSTDSQFSVSNNRSRSNFSPICRSSYIRRNSTCLNMSTVCRGARTQDS